LEASQGATSTYVTYAKAVSQRRRLLVEIAKIPGPSADIRDVRRGLLDPSYAELRSADGVLEELRQQAARHQPNVSEATVARMLRVASVEDPINEFLVRRGLTACRTT